MTNKDYYNFYQECLNNNCTIKKYLPVKDYIFKIVNYFENSGVFEWGYYDENGISIGRVSFIKNVLGVFSKIMEENRYKDLDLYIDFLIKINPWCDDFAYHLDLFIFKKRRDNNDFMSYGGHFVNMCREVIKNKDYVEALNTDNREINMFKLFLRYYKDPNEINLSYEEDQIREYYKTVAPSFLACFLLTDLSIDTLCRVLDELVYNQDTIIDYFNYNNDFSKEYNTLELLRRYGEEKRIIK